MGIDEWSTIIGHDSLGNAKPADGIIADEVCYSRTGSSPEGFCLDLFGLTSVASRSICVGSWVDRTDEVKGLGAK